MERAKTLSLRDSVPLVSDPRNLDASVDEVFQMMLGVYCKSQPDTETIREIPAVESVTAVVGFGGLLSGACVIKCAAPTAVRMAELMTGMKFQDVDEIVKDGIGEILLMFLAGAWKRRVPELAAHCCLSVPAVITGRDYNLRVQAPEFQLEHTYSFEDSPVTVTIVCDGLR